MTVRIMRFTKLLLGLGLAACAWPLSGQNARQEIYADPDKAGGVYYAYTYDNPARTPAPEGYEPFYISHYGRHGSRWLLRASEYTEVLETFGKAPARAPCRSSGRMSYAAWNGPVRTARAGRATSRRWVPNSITGSRNGCSNPTRRSSGATRVSTHNRPSWYAAC